MRIIFIFGNAIALFFTVLLGYLNLSFRASPPDSILNNTPQTKDFNIGIENTTAMGVTTDFSKLLNDNVFSPYRAKEEGDAFSSLKVTGMELVGIISYGDIAGAIVADKGASQAIQPQGVRASTLPGTNQQSKQSGRPQFYKLNEVLPNGFMLKEVSRDSVLLSRGREQIVLQLDFQDEGTKMRWDEGLKLGTKHPQSNNQTQEASKHAGTSGAVVIQPPQAKTKVVFPLSRSQQGNVNDEENQQSKEGEVVGNNTEKLNLQKKPLLRPGEILR